MSVTLRSKHLLSKDLFGTGAMEDLIRELAGLGIEPKVQMFINTVFLFIRVMWMV